VKLLLVREAATSSPERHHELAGEADMSSPERRHELAGQGEGDVRGQRLGERIFLFFIGLTSGPLSMSTHMKFSSPAQHLHVDPTRQIQCQFTLNS
jgi:hypothetical protein